MAVVSSRMPVTIFPPTVDVPTRYTAEIACLTAVNGDVLTLTRHTEDSIPMQIKPGWRVIASATAKTFRTSRKPSLSRRT